MFPFLLVENPTFPLYSSTKSNVVLVDAYLLFSGLGALWRKQSQIDSASHFSREGEYGSYFHVSTTSGYSKPQAAYTNMQSLGRCYTADAVSFSSGSVFGQFASGFPGHTKCILSCVAQLSRQLPLSITLYSALRYESRPFQDSPTMLNFLYIPCSRVSVRHNGMIKYRNGSVKFIPRTRQYIRNSLAL